MILSRFRLLLLAACALVCSGTLSASLITYEIHVDTSTISGTTGTLEFFLNPGATGPVDPATATFHDFTTDGGSYATIPPDIGDVTGSLPGSITLTNAPGADHAESFTFGNFFDIFVDFDVPTISPGVGSGSTLGLNVEDVDFIPILNSPTDTLVLIFTDAAGNQSLTSANPSVASIVVTPEPSTLMLLGSGLLAAVVRSRRHTR